MLNNHLKIYCIIVTYNGAKWVQRCFSSLLRSTLPVNIIAIDNSSSDDTVHLIRANFPTVEIIETGANLGFGKANNIGLKIALKNNSDYIFLLNQDAWIVEDCLEQLVKSFQNNVVFGIVSPIHLNASGNDFDEHFLDYVADKNCPGFLKDNFFNTLKELYPISFVNAAAWMISIHTLKKVGGFDPLFFHYGEDNDYVERVHFHGMQVGVNSRAFIHHDAAMLNTEDFQVDAHRLKVHHLIQLKKITNTYRSNWLLFLKSEWDIQTTMLLFRKFKAWRFRCGVAINMFSYFRHVKIARRKSKMPEAFL